MIDFHTHILPCIDDGASSVEESIALIEQISNAGISTIVATPHFYANQNYPQTFLENRERAYNEIKDKLPRNSPKILLGAEVHYFSGMGLCKELKLLTISGTNLLMVEMPYSNWNEEMFADLYKIQNEMSLQVVIAHLDRYTVNFENRSFIKRFLEEEDFIIQYNLEAFNSILKRNIYVNCLKEKRIFLLGSDCHNLNSRPAKWDSVYPILIKKLGKQRLNRIEQQMKLFLTYHQI